MTTIRPYLAPLQGSTGEDRLDGVVHGPGGGQAQGQAPDQDQLPVAITELCPHMERSGDDVVPGGPDHDQVQGGHVEQVPVNRYCSHGVGGDEH